MVLAYFPPQLVIFALMNFAGITEHAELKGRLRGMVSGGRLPHALLFSGDPTGNPLHLALAFGRFLLCKARTETDCCGKCFSCLKTGKLAHPDLHFSFPIILSKDNRSSDAFMNPFRELILRDTGIGLHEWSDELRTENKQLIIGAEEVREVIRKLTLTSLEGGLKILIMWLPELMNQDAANKLLKILEEPPDETIFMLVSNGADQLLPTILSRTQLIPVPPIARAPKLNESMLTDFRNFMRICLSFDPAKLFPWIEDMHELGRERQKQFLSYCLEVFRESITIKYTPENLNIADAEKEFLTKFHPYITKSNRNQLTEAFSLAAFHIERNVSAKMVLTDLALKTNGLLNKK